MVSGRGNGSTLRPQGNHNEVSVTLRWSVLTPGWYWLATLTASISVSPTQVLRPAPLRPPSAPAPPNGRPAPAPRAPPLGAALGTDHHAFTGEKIPRQRQRPQDFGWGD